MNVYDFDGTIYDGDSTLDFYFFCMKKNPRVLLCLPKQILGFLGYKVRVYPKIKFKEYFYCFFRVIPCIDKYVEEFWRKNDNKIKAWYLDQRKENDVIISASPEFLLMGVCNKIGIRNLIASKVDKFSGRCISNNCYGFEKVTRFKAEYPNEIIDCFYSDALSDIPMAKLAKKSYMVRHNRIDVWPQ